MSGARKYDIIVLGATGFTGTFVVEEVAKEAEAIPEFKFAVAGRSVSKLEACLDTVRRNTGLALPNVGCIIVDVGDDDALVDMAKQGQVVLNCVGPYRFYGEAVVRACVNSGTDHIDISGEPQYLESMQLEYNAKAEENGVHVVGACGFDSIPADMGTVFLQDNFPGDVNSIEMVVAFRNTSKRGAVIHFGTLESAVYGFAHSDELKDIRRKLFPERLPKPVHKPPRRGTVFWSDDAASWCVPNLASDRSVVIRTQHALLQERRPVQFSAYFGMASLLSALGMIVFGACFAIMTSFSFTRKLLLRFPEFFTAGTFSHAGPRREDLAGQTFCMTLTGRGWDTKLPLDQQHSDPPDTFRTVKVEGPDPGYFGTARIMTQCGLTLLQEKNKLPKRGGVFPPGAAFRNTSLISRLQKRGISFTVSKE